MRGSITNKSVAALTCSPGKDREVLWDNAVRGFGVVVFQSGRKVYVCQYRREGRSCRVSLGEHGRLSPFMARAEARKLFGEIVSGSDPIGERRAARGVRTFGQVAEEFLRLHIAAKRKGATLGGYKSILDAHILPAIGSKRIVDVRRADVARMHAKLAATPYLANRALSIISAAWNWAAQRDGVPERTNPVIGLEKYREQARERFLSTEELGRLGDALRSTSIDPFAVAAIRLLILTGARLREILHCQWSQVDFERGVIFLADSKTGKRTLYLSPAALSILAQLPRLKDNPFVIPGEKPGQPKVDLNRPWAAVINAAGLHGLRIHDLRHSFASIGAGAAMGLPIIGKLLGHSQPSTTARYAHLDADPLRRAVDTIGSTISAAMDGGKGGEITILRK